LFADAVLAQSVLLRKSTRMAPTCQAFEASRTSWVICEPDSLTT
jgi:hypothetical protein